MIFRKVRYCDKRLNRKIIILLALASFLGACGPSQPARNRTLSPVPARSDSMDSQNAKDVTSSMSGADSKSSSKSGDGVLRTSYYACTKSTAGETWAIQKCIEQEFEYQDDRLNAAYHQLIKSLPADKEFQIRSDQRKWLADSDKKCKWDEKTEGQAQRLEANYCSLERIAVRADELEAMLK